MEFFLKKNLKYHNGKNCDIMFREEYSFILFVMGIRSGEDGDSVVERDIGSLRIGS